LLKDRLSDSESFFFLPPESTFERVWGSYWSPGFALLREPGGWTAVGIHEPGLVTIDFPSGRFDGWIQPPPPSPGLPQQEYWDAIQPAGDINFDGYDDLFYYAHPTLAWGSYVGLIDGASRQVLWHVAIPDGFFPAPIYPSGPIGWSDLDGDGVADFVVGDLMWHLQTGAIEQTIMALSGLDGHTIWETHTPNGYAGTTGMDINGDSIPDVLVTSSPTETSAISGADGQILWTTNISAMTPLLPPFQWPAYFRPPVFFTETVPGGLAKTVQVTVLGGLLGGTTYDENYLVELDALTGVPLSGQAFPSDLNPWAPEVTSDFLGAQPFFLGDVDRDGYTEIARATPVISNSPPNFQGVASNIIIGKQTLDFPDTLPLAASHGYSIDLPNAGNRQAQLVLSLGFDRELGWTVDHWRTGLMADQMLRWSQGQGLSISLDSQGQGSGSFTLPNLPALIGQTIYARALVPDAAKPGSLWTMSSLGMGEILP